MNELLFALFLCCEGTNTVSLENHGTGFKFIRPNDARMIGLIDIDLECHLFQMLTFKNIFTNNP